MTTAQTELKPEELIVIGWEACRRSVYAVCEDIAGKPFADAPTVLRGFLTPQQEAHSKGFNAGWNYAGKSIARGFNSMGAMDDDNVRAAIAAWNTRAPAVGGVRVKPLKWSQNSEPKFWHSANNLTEYIIWSDGKHFSLYLESNDDEYLGRFNTLEAAKAAAQARHEAAILSALEPQTVNDAMVWQPIETASRDGTWFLGYDGGSAIQDTIQVWHWDADIETETGRGFWVNAAESNIDEYPTHWAPLPAPPADALQAAKEPSHG
jgi:hypothetical protein